MTGVHPFINNYHAGNADIIYIYMYFVFYISYVSNMDSTVAAAYCANHITVLFAVFVNACLVWMFDELSTRGQSMNIIITLWLFWIEFSNVIYRYVRLCKASVRPRPQFIRGGWVANTNVAVVIARRLHCRHALSQFAYIIRYTNNVTYTHSTIYIYSSFGK